MQSHSSELENLIKMRLVRAGAGAGKTTDLVNHILSVVTHFDLVHARLPKLVVTTFTRKATQELKERLFLKALQEADQEKRERLLKYLQSSSAIHISTIHGVLSLFLKKFGHVIGLNPNFSFGSTITEKKKIKKWIKNDIQNNTKEYLNIFSNFDLAKFQQVAQALVPILLYKGGGETWDRQDHQEFRERWFQDLRQHVFLLIEGLQQDLPNKKRTEKSESWFIALDSVNNLLLDSNFNSQNFNWIIVNLRSILAPLKNTSRTVSKSTSDIKDLILDSYLSELSEFQISDDFLPRYQEQAGQVFSIVSRLAQDYLSSKLSQSQVVIDDLENLSNLILRYKPEAAAEFAKDYDYWLVDEYQDTSPAQVDLIDQLSQGKTQYIVGDPQQSIYLFRGARSKVFFDKADWIQKHGGEVKVKMINYRSSPTVMNFVNDLFPKLSDQFLTMQVGTAVERYQDKTNEVVIHRDCEDDAVAAISRVQYLLSKGVKHKDIAVLAMNHKQLRLVSEKLHEFKIPNVLHGSAKYFDRSEVKDVLLILRFMSQPHDDLNLVALLRTPFLGWSDKQLADLALKQKTDLSYWQILKKTPEFDISKLLQLMHLADSFGYVEGLVKSIDELSIWDLLRTTDPGGQKEANIWKLISDLRGQARSAGFQVTEFLLNNDWIITDEEDNNQDAAPILDSEKINLMTIHASKGLEFEHVIIPFLGKKKSQGSTRFEHVFWDEDRMKWSVQLYSERLNGFVKHPCCIDQELKQKEREDQERLRVLYVGMTRAKNSLCLTWAKPSSSSLAQLIQERFPNLEQYVKPIEVVESGSAAIDADFDLNFVLKPDLSILPSSNANEISVTKLVSQHFTKSAGSEFGEADKQIDINWILQSLEKAVDGVRVHRLFQNLKFRLDIDQAIDSVDEDLKGIFYQGSVDLKNIIKSGFVEMSLTCQIRPELTLIGQIDLWGRESDGTVWVIDYKTGSIKHQRKAFLQLQIYSLMLRKLNLIKPEELVKLAVIYPYENRFLIQDEDTALRL